MSTQTTRRGHTDPLRSRRSSSRPRQVLTSVQATHSDDASPSSSARPAIHVVHTVAPQACTCPRRKADTGSPGTVVVIPSRNAVRATRRARRRILAASTVYTIRAWVVVVILLPAGHACMRLWTAQPCSRQASSSRIGCSGCYPSPSVRPHIPCNSWSRPRRTCRSHTHAYRRRAAVVIVLPATQIEQACGRGRSTQPSKCHTRSRHWCRHRTLPSSRCKTSSPRQSTDPPRSSDKP